MDVLGFEVGVRMRNWDSCMFPLFTVKAAHQGDLPDSVLNVIDSATKYVEGRGVRIEVRTRNDLESVKSLAAVKMAN